MTIRAEAFDAGRRACGRAALVLGLALAAAACSSGSAGSGVAIGSPQSAGDPVLPDYPIAYVRRALPDPADPNAIVLEDDLRVQRVWNGPADVWIRDRGAPNARERNVTERLTRGLWDVRDLEVSYDGSRLLFAMRPPIDENDDESRRPKWAIYEYAVESDRLRRVIASDIVANEGHDVAPHYLPDGRILFSSSRQRGARAVLIDEGKSQFSAGVERVDRNLPAFVLHVMNADGTGIRQLSYNMSHDLDPAVLNDGRVLFTRWDNVVGGQGMHLYSMNPDGSALQLLYGRRSHETGTNGATVQFVQARPRPDGRVVALLRPFADTEFGGEPVLIDVQTFVENHQPVRAGGGSGPAQSRLVVNDVRTIPGPSPGGRFSSIFPLWDGTNRLLTSWTLCRVVEQGRILPCTSDRLAQSDVQLAPPLYGIWIYDPRQNTQLPIVAPHEGVMYTEVVALQPRTPPAALQDAVAGVNYPAALAAEGVGILNIRSVYDFDGRDLAPGGITTVRDPASVQYASRPARFLRIEKAVGLPDEEVLQDLPGYAFGVSGVGMRELIGYAPVEPDGSVRVKVPSNVPLDISVLDADGRRIGSRHRNWLQVRSGEVVTCAGCHDPQPGANGEPPRSHGRQGSVVSANPGAPGSAPFANTRLVVPDTIGTLVAALRSPEPGETMAEYRARAQQDCTVLPCALAPSVNLDFIDTWRIFATVPDREATAIRARYSTLATPLPTDCDARWEARCRVTIHYPRHVAPLWMRPRVLLADPNDPTSVIADRTCTGCHSPTNPANGQPQVPAAQLDLRNDPSDTEPLQMRSFRELLFPDVELELAVTGQLRPRLVPGPVDPVSGLPTQVTVPVRPLMSGGGARASGRFFATFAPGGRHYDARDRWLTPAELKLIAEWLDLGGAYYNDPFAIPVQ